VALSSAQKIPACTSSPPDIAALTARAESGDAKAQLALGQAFYETRDPEKLSRAVYWFTKAAERGNADAEWRLVGAYGAGEEFRKMIVPPITGSRRRPKMDRLKPSGPGE
jgi:TPR repeat protein